jgi:parallel beta-helix repeat protein
VPIVVKEKRVLTVLIVSFFIYSSFSSNFGIVMGQQYGHKAIYVPDDYPTIKEAVANAVEGDQVFVRNGTYFEENIVLDKNIQLIGLNRDSTIIQSLSDKPIIVVNHTSLPVIISGFTLIAGNAPQPIVSTSPYDKTKVGIQVENSKAHFIIENNKIVNCGTAIWLHSSSQGTVESNILQDDYYGIDITDSSTKDIIKENNISSCRVGIRFADRNVNYTLVNANTIASCYTGLFYYFTSQNFAVGNNIAYNTAATHFVGSHKNVLHHNNFISNLRDISEDSSYYDIVVPKSINFWDDEEEGNYWSRYQGSGSTPYTINEFNKDNHPLASEVNTWSYIGYSYSSNPYALPYQSPTQSPITSPASTPNYSPISPSPSPTISEIPAALATVILVIATLASTLAIKRKKYQVISNRLTNKQSF